MQCNAMQQAGRLAYEYRSLVAHAQAVKAVESFNGTELSGRKILVREDREDRDVKNYNRENGIEREAPPRSAGRSSGRGGRGRGRDGGGPSQQYNSRPPPRAGPEGEEESSGLQVGNEPSALSTLNEHMHIQDILYG